MKIVPLQRLIYSAKGKIVSSRFFINNEHIEISIFTEFNEDSKKEIKTITYTLNKIPTAKNTIEELLGYEHSKQLGDIEDQLTDFSVRHQKVEYKHAIDNYDIWFSFYKDELNINYDQLTFVAQDNSAVEFNNYLQCTNFNTSSIQEAFRNINTRISETLTKGDEWDLITSDIIIFDEYFRITKEKSFYYGFKDVAPYVNPVILFELPTEQLVELIEAFILFVNINETEK